MKRRFVYWTLFAALGLGLTARTALPVTINGVQYQQEKGVWFVYDEDAVAWQVAPPLVHIEFDMGVTATQIDTFATNHGLTGSSVLVPGGFRRFSYDPESDPIVLLQNLIASPIVLDAELDRYVVKYGIPNDDHYLNYQWNLVSMDLERAWDVTTGANPVTIAIFDGGVDRGHVDLYQTRWTNPNDQDGDDVDNDQDYRWFGVPLVDDYWGWDFVSGSNEPLPSDPHGTAVAGVALASRDNGEGIASPSGGSQSSHPIKWASVVANTQFAAVDALRYCRHKGFDVINFSVGFDNIRNTAGNQLDSLYAAGALMFGASGNYGQGVAFPAAHSGVIAVGAVDDSDGRWYYSGTGSLLEVCAPSGDVDPDGSVFVIATDNYGSYVGYDDTPPCLLDCYYYPKFGGTSAASPAAAGVGALLLSYNPVLSNVEARRVLRDASVDLGPAGVDTLYGYGKVNAYRTLTQWGTIASDTTWGESGSATTVYVSGDLTIAGDATLTLEPGTVVKIAPDDNESAGTDTLRVEINVEGALVAAGTANDPIVFEGWNDQSSDVWVGFYIDALSAGATFEHCTIRNAEYAIENWVDIAVSDCVIEDCAYAGIAAQDGALTVDNTEIAGTGAWGVFLASANGTLRGLTVTDCVSAGVNVQASATMTAKGCSFLSNENGVYVNDTYGSVVVDSLCAFKHNDTGFYSYSAFPHLSASVIDSNTTAGIYCDAASDPEISENSIQYNTVGIYCTNASSPLVEANTIANNTIGVYAAYDSDPDIGHATMSGQNAIHTNGTYHVANFSASVTLKAEDNWWGSANGPKASKIVGAVDYNPFLTSAPSAPESYPAPVPMASGPRNFALGSITPNPFNPSTIIHYDVPTTGGRVTIRIYDVAGRLVRELVNDFRPGGFHEAFWDGTTGRGERVASAVYFVEMRSGSFSQAKKLVLLK